MTTLWQHFEDEFLVGLESKTFTHQLVQDTLGVSGPDATALIQGYKQASRAAKRKTKFVMHRAKGRTASTIWAIGHTAADAASVAHTFGGDVMVKVQNDVDPLCRVILDRNPRALPKVAEINRELGRLIQQLEQLANI